MTLRLVFGVHLHQPVGNHDSVFRDHVEGVYLPFLEALHERGFGPVAVHTSGPLLDWARAHDPRLIDLLGRMVRDGRAELLASGYYEPVLAVWDRPDRIEQIQRMREVLKSTFGADGSCLWLTERVWEPDLPRDLSDAGIESVLVDDRHLLAAGIEPAAIDRPFRTEAAGRSVALLAIDERLRYLVPFHSQEDIGAHLDALADDGRSLAVLVDDGEKFGGWPGTRERVYGQGWLTGFLNAMSERVERGGLELVVPTEAVRRVPSGGLVYLPTGSYREMEAWSLPSGPAARLSDAREWLVEAPDPRLSADSPFLRGGHWRGFLAKYPEANRLHKKALFLSERSREPGAPPAAREAVLRAQCNDALWHGVFGGLYLAHLRAALWRELALAESLVRDGEPLGVESVDTDLDGHSEVLVHSDRFAAVVAPHRGGCVEELTWFGRGENLVDVLTRRREPYHRTRGEGETTAPADGSETPSIHELEDRFALSELPAVDLDARALFVDRALPSSVDRAAYELADYEPAHSWASRAPRVHTEVRADRAVVRMVHDAPWRLDKTVSFDARGAVRVEYAWDPAEWPDGARFAPELSLGKRPPPESPPESPLAPGSAREPDDPIVDFEPVPLDVWRFDIETVSRTEKGFSRSGQGRSLTPLWDRSIGSATVTILPPVPRETE